MPAKPERERVAMTHPTGRFTVQVSPARAVVLEGRGYTPHRKAAAEGQKRPELNARAHELGIPASGTNTELAKAIATAEEEAEAGRLAAAGGDPTTSKGD